MKDSRDSHVTEITPPRTYFRHALLNPRVTVMILSRNEVEKYYIKWLITIIKFTSALPYLRELAIQNSRVASKFCHIKFKYNYESLMISSVSLQVKLIITNNLTGLMSITGFLSINFVESGTEY